MSICDRNLQIRYMAATGAVAATARNADKSQIFIGQSGADSFTGGNLSDVMFAGAGASNDSAWRLAA